MRHLVFIGICWLTAACAPPRMYVVSSQTSVSLNEALTFSLVNESLPPTQSHTGEIYQELENQMIKNGYWKSAKDPDILVFTKYYPEKISLPHVVRAPDNELYLNQQPLPKGILMVQWVHSATQKTIWQGYAVGVSPRLENRQWQYIIRKVAQRFPKQTTTLVVGN